MLISSISPLPINEMMKRITDPDARAYAALTGATDIFNINGWCKGLKALGLWNNMVCWPLLSSQNRGTGSTAYSLGGLGTYNGTLINGPSWGVNGVDHAASSSQTTAFPINLVPYGTAGFSLLSVGKVKTTASSYAAVFGQEGGGTSNCNSGIRLQSNPASGVEISVNFAGGIAKASWNNNILGAVGMVAATVSSPTVSLYWGSGLVATASTSGAYNSLREGADTLRVAQRCDGTGAVDSSDLTSAFCGFIATPVSSQTIASLYSLYKSTIGSSLALP